MASKSMVKSFSILFDSITGSLTDPIEIQCSYFRNPIIPEINEGYVISTKDTDGNQIEVSSEFSLDASGYAPYPIPAGSVQYSLDGSTTV